MTISLLCDVATFGKINVKNLKKIQKLNLSKADNFSRVSALPQANTTDLRVHDAIAHQAIPQTIKRYLPNSDKIKFTKDAKKVSFLPLINPSNQAQKGLRNPDKRRDTNRYIENLVRSIEGNATQEEIKKADTSYIIGKALRKKKLTEVEKLATNNSRSELIEDLITSKRIPTQEDVKLMLQRFKNKDKQRFEPKTKGVKPQPKTIEEKKSGLKQKYAIQK